MEKPSKDKSKSPAADTPNQEANPAAGPRLVTTTLTLPEAKRIAEEKAEAARAAGQAAVAARTEAEAIEDEAERAAAMTRVHALTKAAAKAAKEAERAASEKTALESKLGQTAMETKAQERLKEASAAAMPMAGGARLRLRHVVLAASFLIWVCIPLGVAAWYLFFVAKDQYASSVGFAVRTEEVGSAIELLGGITELSGSSSSDTDVLYEFTQSQNMVRAINDRIDLRAAYSQPEDPFFGLDPDVRIEGLVDYWQRMVKIFYDRGSGLIEIRVLAFDPETAQKIAQAIFDESSDMINKLSSIARADTTRYAREELTNAINRLKEARAAITEFRVRTQIIDPVTDIQGRMGLVNSLQTQLAEALIELDLVRRTTPESDPRVQQAERRVEVIRERLDEERARFSDSGESKNASYSSLVGEYEGLAVEREFAEKAYVSALAAFDTAQAEAQRKSRYLATYIDPTVAESSKFPKRWNMLGILGSVLFLSWAIAVLIYYSVRDRR